MPLRLSSTSQRMKDTSKHGIDGTPQPNGWHSVQEHLGLPVWTGNPKGQNERHFQWWLRITDEMVMAN